MRTIAAIAGSNKTVYTRDVKLRFPATGHRHMSQHTHTHSLSRSLSLSRAREWSAPCNISETKPDENVAKIPPASYQNSPELACSAASPCCS